VSYLYAHIRPSDDAAAALLVAAVSQRPSTALRGDAWSLSRAVVTSNGGLSAVTRCILVVNLLPTGTVCLSRRIPAMASPPGHIRPLG
jgi:hypothetical protein